MDSDILLQLLKVGGVGALAIGAVYLLFKEPIRKIAFPQLEAKQAYTIVLVVLFAIWSLAMVGVVMQSRSAALSGPAFEHIPRRFVYSTGSFDKTGLTWREHTGFNNVTFTFVQDGVVDGYLQLVDSSRLKDNNDANRPFTVRLPLNGGMAQWSYPNPFIWQDLYMVHPED